MALYVYPGVMGQPPFAFNLAAAPFNSASLFTNESGVHTSAGVPPQLLLIKPMGTFRSLFNFFPKKYPTALKVFRVLLSHTVHLAAQSSCGLVAVVLGI